MIVQKDFLNKLKDFGLNSYETKLWAAILSRGVSTAGELSDIAGVPRSRSYDVLESLEKKGFVIMKIGKPIKYVALPPETVLDRVKNKILSDAEEQTSILSGIKDTPLLSELNLLYNKGVDMVEPFELSGSLKGRKNIYVHLDQKIRDAKKSVVMMTSSAGLMRKIDSLTGSLKKAKARGVRIRIAAPVTAELKEELSKITQFAEVRSTSQQGRFCVVDGEDITFMVMGDEQINPAYDVGIWVNTPFFAGAFEKMFDASWKGMKALK